MDTVMKDRIFAKAVSNIVKRSERQEDISLLRDSFVDDVGAYDQIDNNENQIIYGRRGTGKTHLLKVLQADKEQQPETLAIYIDIRNLGSTNQFTDRDRPVSLRCYGLIKDLLGEMHNSILEYASTLDAATTSLAFEQLNNLAETITQVVLQEQEVQISRSEQIERLSSDEASISLQPKNIDIKVGGKDEAKTGSQSGTSVTAKPSYSFVIPDISSKLRRILDGIGIKRFYVFVDEWSTIDSDLQPYFAEFLKRAFLPSPKFILKIAALEYRSKFFIKDEGSSITGFELGGDIAADVNLDDYYVFDKNPSLVSETFGKVLFNHINAQLEEAYLEKKYGIDSWERFVSSFFTSNITFSELVRAAEGVARDLINIFNLSYFGAKNSLEKIDVKTIEQAARNWYQQDKESNLSEKQSYVMNRIVDDVIGHRKARSFLLEQQHAKDEMIRALFDARVIHLMQKGYSDQDTPGVRFDIYSLDYGTYVHLKRTSSQPELKLIFFDDPEEEPITEDRIVPFDDKRSIRRVILTKDILDRAARIPR